MPRRHRSSSSSSSLLSPPVLIILLPTVILLFLIYAIPPLLSLTSHILQPTVSVKKSWDSLNVFLVIFAILCGVFARKHDDVAEDDVVHIHHNANSDPLPSPQQESVLLPQQQWFGYSDGTSRMYDTAPVKTPENVVGGGGLRRRSSYPDLRQVESLWETLDEVQTKSQFRFFDDFEISNYRTTHRQSKETSSDDVKDIKVDTFVPQPSSTPPPKSPEPPPPPPPPPRREKQRTYETVGRRKEKVVEEVKIEEVRSTPPPTPPPPPQPPRTVAPPSPMRVRSDQKHGRLERRKSNVKKEIAMVWNSVLSNQRKRKRKQKATRNIYDTATPEQPPGPSQPPPPPPLPPPSSVFHNLFKKGSKAKKVHSVPTAPPPPPTAAVSVRTYQTRPRSTLPPPEPPTTPRRPPPAAHSRRRPPLPTKPSTSDEVDNVNTFCPSPLIPVPPPPPPFKMPAMKFFVKGDYVKILSAQSSRNGSPEPEEVADHALPADKKESTSTSKVNVTDGGDGAGRASPSVFCPSPDVNTKADNFIARLRDEWRLEKINSLRENKMN